MEKRFISLWFRFLEADWHCRKQSELKDTAYVIAAPERGRKVVKAISKGAAALGLRPGMVVADAKAVYPELEVLDAEEGLACRLLQALALWCIRYTPVVAVDPPDGLLLDISGCAHLWGGERAYLRDILDKLSAFGYHVRAAIAGTPGAAWAVARYGRVTAIIERGAIVDALLPLPPAALRLETATVLRLEKLGLSDIGSFMQLQRPALRRRFGQALLDRLDQATGKLPEPLLPVIPVVPYQERLPCLEPIRTATGIEIALQKLLQALCLRLEREGKGLRKAVLKTYRIDGRTQEITIGTGSGSRSTGHLFKLFQIHISTIAPGLGIELFILEAPLVEDMDDAQAGLWQKQAGDRQAVVELLDRIAAKVGEQAISRYLPKERHWPERSLEQAASFDQKAVTDWPSALPRPLQLLPKPELIEVSAPIPDYPPMLFIYQGQVHQIKKADGPERVEQEWWQTGGLFRDYYGVEDEQGRRYWIFRAGHYADTDPHWFIHGFFA